jgi:steroid 5-alpha reductase family enzyme
MKKTTLKRLGWFGLLYGASLLTFLVVTWALRLTFH